MRCVSENDDGGKESTTTYQILESVQSGGSAASLVMLKPLQGRTHQLRVHCAEILGLHIIGDKKYCNARVAEEEDLQLCLHALHLRLCWTDREVRCVAPIPEHFRAAALRFGFTLKTLTDIESRLMKSANPVSSISLRRPLGPAIV
eukprot:750854-Hanusia_phi.AAC.5